VLAAAETALAATTDWSVLGVKTALETALIEELGLKPRVAFGPVRVATSGRRVSPPLFESLAILGSAESLARIRTLRSALAPTA
jgi:glutamyl-tRNA synthetase